MPRATETTIPHDLDAEKSVLGAILIDNETFAQAAEILQPPDFYRRAHQVLFARSAALAARGTAIDPITLKDALGAELEKVGGIAYISSLTDGVPRRTNIAHYAKIVRTHSRTRRLQRAVAEVQHDFQDGDLDRATARLRDLVGRLDEADDHFFLDAEALADAVDVAEEGRAIERDGIQYLVEGWVPRYPMVGMIVAFAKVGKSTFGLYLAKQVATGQAFLGRQTTRVRVLVLAAEDPPPYTAYLARHLELERERLTFYRAPLVFDPRGLDRVVRLIQRDGYGLVLASSWQTLVCGLVRDENDNASAVQVMEHVKAAARRSGIPWLLDAHSGKGEDQTDEADPLRALRGASAAAGVADFMFSLRYVNGAFGTQRRLSGKGKFVSCAPLLLEFDPATSSYSLIADTKTAASETVWTLITTMGALDETPRTAGDIAHRAGLVAEGKHLSNTHRRQVQMALARRPEVGKEERLYRGSKTTFYKWLKEPAS